MISSVPCKQVLSLKLYKSEQPSSAAAAKPAKKDESKAKEKTTQESGATASPTTISAKASATEEQNEGGHDPLEGLDDITKTCFEVCALFVITALVAVGEP